MKKRKSRRDIIGSAKTNKLKSRVRPSMPLRDKIELICFSTVMFLVACAGAELYFIKREVHSHGIISQIDINSQALLYSNDTASSLTTIYWDYNTKFEIDGVITEASALRPSMKVAISKKDSLFFSKKATKISVLMLVN